MDEKPRDVNNSSPSGNNAQRAERECKMEKEMKEIKDQLEKIKEIEDYLLKEIQEIKTTLTKPQEDRADVVVGNASDNHTGHVKKIRKLLSMKFSKDEIKDVRGWLLGGSVMLASVTYSAALNPPGGSWSIKNGNYTAGEPIFRDMHQLRYFIFYYCDVIAFAGAFNLIFLLLMLTKEKFDDKLLRMVGVHLTVCGMAVSVALIFGSNIGGPWWSLIPAIIIIFVYMPCLHFFVLKDAGII